MADVVGDPRVGLGAGFFNLLGAEGSVELANEVWRSTPIDMYPIEMVGTVAEIVAAYGDGMAVADRQDELRFTAGELLAVEDPDEFGRALPWCPRGLRSGVRCGGGSVVDRGWPV